MITEAVAATGALVTGPAVLHLVSACRRGEGRSSAVESAAVVLLVGLLVAAATGIGRLLLVAPLAVFGTAAAVVDVHERRLPNLLTGALAITTAAVVVLVTAASGDVEAAVRSAVAAVATAAAATLLKTAGPACIGWGDVKLLPSLAAALAWVGPAALYRGVVASSMLVLVTVVVWSLSRVDRQGTVPYGPALLAGALGPLLWT